MLYHCKIQKPHALLFNNGNYEILVCLGGGGGLQKKKKNNIKNVLFHMFII